MIRMIREHKRDLGNKKVIHNIFKNSIEGLEIRQSSKSQRQRDRKVKPKRGSVQQVQYLSIRSLKRESREKRRGELSKEMTEENFPDMKDTSVHIERAKYWAQEIRKKFTSSG